MIKIEIKAEDYYVADAMSDLVRRIESEDLLDSVYEDRTDMITIHEEKYTATISKINEEKTPTTTSDNKQNMIEDRKLYATREMCERENKPTIVTFADEKKPTTKKIVTFTMKAVVEVEDGLDDQTIASLAYKQLKTDDGELLINYIDVQ